MPERNPVYPSAFGWGVYEPYDELSAEVMANNAILAAQCDELQRRNRPRRLPRITPLRVVQAVLAVAGAAVIVGAIWVSLR